MICVKVKCSYKCIHKAEFKQVEETCFYTEAKEVTIVWLFSEEKELHIIFYGLEIISRRVVLHICWDCCQAKDLFTGDPKHEPLKNPEISRFCQSHLRKVRSTMFLQYHYFKSEIIKEIILSNSLQQTLYSSWCSCILLYTSLAPLNPVKS